MAGMLPGNDLHQDDVTTWYFSRKEIEYNSPSRRDGIDLKTETFLRKSYCTLLKDLGNRLTLPHITIATAIVFCHRFFIHQSHAKNDRWMIAKVCMLLAGKVEETPRALKDIIIFSNEIIHKKELDADQRKEVYEQQKELVLKGELLVLSTLNFDLNVRHPYKPLAEAIEKYKVKEANAQFPKFAQSLVNGCLRTSLCLQYKPHHIAAYVFYQAATYLETKLQAPQEVLLKEFDITLSQLEDMRDQMLGLDIWYFSREEIENNSPSKLDGVDIKTEAQLRKKYCTFLIDLGARLKVNQIPVSTAIVLCHRFFSRQSHAKNDHLTIATVCMLLATKVEDSERDIEDVIGSSYEIIHKETLDDEQREEVYEQQNELVLSGEYLVLSTLNFDLNVRHPYLPLEKAIWKYKVKEANAHFPIVARSFVNECLQTTLSLQYKPRHIAGYGFFVAVLRLKMQPQLRAYANALLQEFDITRSQLKDMGDQMRELSKNDSNESGTQNPVQDRSSPERTGMASESEA